MHMQVVAYVMYMCLCSLGLDLFLTIFSPQIVADVLTVRGGKTLMS